VSTVVDDFGTGIGLETFFPGRDEGSMSDDFAGGIYLANP